MKNQKGFSALEGLLILVIVGIIGFVGYYVWHAKNSTNRNLNSAASQNISPATKRVASSGSTANWKAYSSSSGKYSLKYPAAWAKLSDSQCETYGLLLLGGSAKAVGNCSDLSSNSQMEVAALDGNNIADSTMKESDGFVNITSKDVTVDGVKGTRQEGTAKGQQSMQGQIAPLPDGTVAVQYSFFANSKTYVLVYIKTTAYPDVMSDFDTMVTKTLKFQS